MKRDQIQEACVLFLKISFILVVVCALSSAQSTDSGYIIVSPKNNDVLKVGDTATIVLNCTENNAAGMELLFNKFSTPIPGNIPDSLGGFSSPFSTISTKTFKFVVLPYITNLYWSDSLNRMLTDTTSLISDSVRIRMFKYSDPSATLTISDGYFRIVEASSVRHAAQILSKGPMAPHSYGYLQLLPDNQFNNKTPSSAGIFSIDGRVVREDHGENIARQGDKLLIVKMK